MGAEAVREKIVVRFGNTLTAEGNSRIRGKSDRNPGQNHGRTESCM